MRVFTSVLAVVVLVVACQVASASLTITAIPYDAGLVLPDGTPPLVAWSDTIGPGQAAIDTYIDSLYPGLTGTEIGKVDLAPYAESGVLTGLYKYSVPVGGDAGSDADIEYMGDGTTFAKATHLLVKDGNADPIWYLYDLSSWDGMETIELRDFWPDGGGISHITLYGTVVPEAGSLLVWGTLALTGLCLCRRKLFA